MRRWLAVSLALVVALGAAYVLATSGAHQHAPEIDEASRRKLVEVLRDESP